MFLVSPILNRELLSFLRTRRAIVGLFAYLVLLSFAVYSSWNHNVEGVQSVERDVVSRGLFQSITMWQLLIFSVYALVLTATKINSERDTNTLEILLSAPMSTWHLLMAKYASALTVVLVLSVASVPMLTPCFLLGGVGWDEYVSSYIILFLTVLTVGMIGMACSAACRRNHTSLLVGFLILLLLQLLVPFFVGPLAAGDESLTVAAAVSSFSFYSAIRDGKLSGVNLWETLAIHTLVQAFIFAFSYFIASGSLRALAEGGSAAAQRRERLAASRAGASNSPSHSPKRTKRITGAPRPLKEGVNPVFGREDRYLYSRRHGGRVLRWGGVIILGAFTLMALGSLPEPWNYTFDEHMCVFAFLLGCMAALLVPAMSARAVTSEREGRSLALLLATALKPKEILFGKMLALLKRAWLAMLIFGVVVVFAYGQWAGVDQGELYLDFLRVLVPLSAAAFFFASIGILFSVLCLRTITAMAMTYGLLFAMMAGPLLIGALLGAFSTSDYGWAQRSGFFATAIPLMFPPAYFVHDSLINRWCENAEWKTALSYCIVLCGIGAAVLAYAVQRFESRFREDL